MAAVLRSAAHPAWHYSTSEPGLDGKKVRRVLGAKAWVALVHQFAGLPDESGLGLVPRTLRKTKRELELDLPGCLAGAGDLASDLDVVTVTSGADARREARDADAKKQAAIDKAQLDAFRAARTARFEARKAAFRILKAGGSMGGAPRAIPSSGDRDELAAWTNAAAGFWRGGSGSRLYASGDVAGLVEVLSEKITARGFSVEDSGRAAEFVFQR